MGVRILLADDHRMVREGLRALLETQPGWKVVGEAGDGHEAIRLARETAPDVAIIDLSLPRLNGVDATRRILSESPGLKVVALSTHGEPERVGEVLRAGAVAYVLKENSVEELESAIRTVLVGEFYLRGRVLRDLVEQYLRVPSSISPAALLSNREREVLQPLAEGKNTREIAEALGVSAKTVETHRKHIMAKLGIYTVPELTKYAIREGLTSLAWEA